jgi:hypothetical protein
VGQSLKPSIKPQKSSSASTNTGLRSAILAAGLIVFPVTCSTAQTAGPDVPYAIVDRGPYYRVWQKTIPVTNNLTGQITQQVHAYTELGDGMHYWSGARADSQTIVEITPTGAQAVHGQITARFSGDIASIGAIQLTAGSDIFRSSPLGLYYYDSAIGKVARIAPAQSGQAILYPPNLLVFSNLLAGLDADLMAVWATNGYEQNLVLKQRPPTPESFGFSSATTRLQFWTAMDSCPAPLRQRTLTLKSGLVDHILDFTNCWFPVGSAFAFGTLPLPAPGEPGLVRVMDPSAPDAIPVAKSLVNVSGLAVLVEEIIYSDLLAASGALPQASVTPLSDCGVELADRGQLLPNPAPRHPEPAPILLAAGQYSTDGFVLDYTTLPVSASTYSFAKDSTFFIPSSFTVSARATFRENACIKYGANAYFMFSEASADFPSGVPPIIFTSKDDNAYGEVIAGSSSEPGYAAAKAIWVYNRTTSVSVTNIVMRWAQEGIHYTEETGANLRPRVDSSVFQNCSTGVNLDIANDTLYLSGDSYCNVLNPTVVTSGYKNGSITASCAAPIANAPVDASKLIGVEGEPSIAVNPHNPNNVFVIANELTNNSYPNVFAARSTDRGSTWTPAFQGASLGDPTAVFDSFGNLFVSYIDASYASVDVLLGNEDGSSFTPLQSLNVGGFADSPLMAVGPSGAQAPSAVWVAFQSGLPNQDIAVAGAPINGFGNVGAWASPIVHIANSDYLSANPNGHIAVGPTGQVAVVFENTAQPYQILMSLNPTGLGQIAFAPPAPIAAVNPMPSPDPPAFYHGGRGPDARPRLAWDRTGGQYRGRLYLTYTDRIPGNSQNDTDIWFKYSNDNGTSWSGAKKINDDSGGATQFQGRVIVDQTSGKVAVCWYDCRDDAANIKTKCYAAVSSDGGQTFSSNFPLESGKSDATQTSPQLNNNYFEYSGLAYYGGYFFAAWADNSNTTGGNPDGQMDIYVAKVKY